MVYLAQKVIPTDWCETHDCSTNLYHDPPSFWTSSIWFDPFFVMWLIFILAFLVIMFEFSNDEN